MPSSCNTRYNVIALLSYEAGSQFVAVKLTLVCPYGSVPAVETDELVILPQVIGLLFDNFGLDEDALNRSKALHDILV